MAQYIFLLLVWIFFGASHSLLATDLAKKKLSFIGKYYRLFYNLVSFIVLFGALLYMAMAPVEWIWPPGQATRFFGLVFATFGILVVKKAFGKYDLKSFLGLGQIKGKDGEGQFIREGILQKVRHPLYLGTIFLLIGFFIFSPSYSHLISVVALIAYTFIGIYFEERKLVKEYGEKYKAYQKEVPMVFPKNIFGVFS